MVKAIWNGQVIAESDKTIMIENNHYFPPESIKHVFFKESDHTTICPWKGTARYYDVIVEGKRCMWGAWYYPVPSEKASQIKNHLAFWNGIEVEVPVGYKAVNDIPWYKKK